MKINSIAYRYQVCPACNSKRIGPVALVILHDSQWDFKTGPDRIVKRSGYLCHNCGHYHVQKDTKHITDRAEMRRDINRLIVYLGVKAKNNECVR